MSRLIMRTWIALLLVTIGPPGLAEDGRSAVERFPPGSITTAEAAEQALQALQAERAAAQARFMQEQGACHNEFFATRCLDQARERRRRALRPLETLEVEASRFQRQQRALERDRALAARRAEAERLQREAPAIGPVPESSPPAAPRSEAPQPEQPRARAPREARAAPTPEQERADARRRAESEAAYARKVQNAKTRQEAVARNKAEKERRRAQAGTDDETAQPR